jgi:transposase-like protein
MARQRRSFSADFKARVALEALREQKTINELASEVGVHPNLIREWKKHLLDELPQVFEPPQSRRGENTGAGAGADVSTDRPVAIRARVVEKKSWSGPLSRSGPPSSLANHG